MVGFVSVLLGAEANVNRVEECSTDTGELFSVSLCQCYKVVNKQSTAARRLGNRRLSRGGVDGQELGVNAQITMVW